MADRTSSGSGSSRATRSKPADISAPRRPADQTAPEMAAEEEPAPEPIEAEAPDETTPAMGGGPRVEEVLELFREFLRTSQRLIDLIPAPASTPGIAEAARTSGPGQLVYVHGIGAHAPGFSDDWWEAMRPYTPSLWPGTLGGNRHEAYWSDLVNRIRPQTVGGEPQELDEPEAQLLAEELRAAIADRVEQQRTVAAAVAQSATLEAESHALAAPEIHAELAIGPDLELFEGLDDFVRYLTNRDLRERILKRFSDTVDPLLRSGSRVEIIAHSWGTVIAYEGLRRLDAAASTIRGSVHNLFTAGSALSIHQVKSRLLPEARDGLKPRLVRNWLNLDAEGDPIGGWLRGRPFHDDREFTNLPAVGCGKFLRILPNPVCAHGSYFLKANVLVNRDIFGRYIEGP